MMPAPPRVACGCTVSRDLSLKTDRLKTDTIALAYHTGAGLGDAVLDSDKSVAMEAYYNKTDSQQYFTYPNNEIGGWPLAIQYGPYQCKSPQTRPSNFQSALD